MKLKEININKDLKIWDNILKNSPDFYTISHNPALLDFLQTKFGWEGVSFFIMDQEDVIGLYQHSYVSEKKAV